MVCDAGLHVQQLRNQRHKPSLSNGNVNYRNQSGQHFTENRAPPPRYPFNYIDSYAQTAPNQVPNYSRHGRVFHGGLETPMAREYPVYDDTPEGERPSAFDYHVYDEVPLNGRHHHNHNPTTSANMTKSVNRNKSSISSSGSDPVGYESDSDDFMVI
jgi:hypothetical protein